LLRTGAGELFSSGLKHQDNDLIVIESAEAAAASDEHREDQPGYRYGRRRNLSSKRTLNSSIAFKTIEPLLLHECGERDAWVGSNDGSPIILDHSGCVALFHAHGRVTHALLQTLASVG
jgi:hypothetical protein